MKFFALAKNNLRLFGIFVFGLFLLIGCVGLPHSVLSEHVNGEMAPGCPVMPGAHSLCQMDALEHIAAWQDTVTALPSQFASVLLTLLLALASVFVARSLALNIYSFFEPFNASPPPLYAGIFIPIANPLQEAFSNGILHPKIF
ncbi:MAG: hypothetical protein ACJKTH_01790 [Patescibacteria group bacterium UBA2163]